MIATNNYNGIITKVKAMESNLLHDSDFDTLTSMETVPEVISFLKERDSKKYIFSQDDEDISHRGQIEHLLSYSIFKDFKKIYKFAFGEARNFLDIYFLKIEIAVLKDCITALHSNDKKHYIFYNNDFLIKHAEFNINNLLNSNTLDEFINNLAGTKYYSLFKQLHDLGITNLFEYKSSLDIYYFKKVWKQKEKCLTGDSKLIYTALIGKEIDLLNIVWTYRCKKYYDVDSSVIYSKYIIPINYKLSKTELSNLVETSSITEFINVFNSTYYGKHGEFDFKDLDGSINKILYETYEQCIKKYPHSMAPVHFYIYKKRYETERIIYHIEKIRYKVNQNSRTVSWQ